jgi:hypothetical protein
MKIADKRHDVLENKTLPWMLHIVCDCGSTFGWEPARGPTVTCPDCKRSATVAGADVSPIAGMQT